MQVPINTGTSEALGFYWLQYRHCFGNSIKTLQVLLFLQLLFHIKYCNTKRCSLSGFPPSIQSAHIHTLVKDSKYMAISYISYDRTCTDRTCTVAKFPASCRGLVKLLQLPGRPHTVIPLLLLPGTQGRFGMHQLHKHTDTACIPEDSLALANDHSLFLCSTQQLALEPCTWLFTASFPDWDNFGAHKKVISLCGFP